MQFEKKLRKKIFGAHSQSLPMYINSLGVDVYLSMQLLRMDEIVSEYTISRNEKGKIIRVTAIKILEV